MRKLEIFGLGIAISVVMADVAGVAVNQVSKTFAQVGYDGEEVPAAPATPAPTAVTQTPAEEPPAEEQPVTTAAPEEPCQTIELDQRTTFQNGTGYQVDINNCSAFNFSATDENNNLLKYAVLVDRIDEQGVGLNVVSADDPNRSLARLALATGEEKTFEPSPLATTALRAKLISIKDGNEATLQLARTARKAPISSSSTALIIGVVVAAAAIIALLLYFVLRRR